MRAFFFNLNQGNRNNRAGQVIVEVTVALGVLTIGYLSILSLLNRSLGMSNIVSDQNIATYLSVEGIELTKNLLDAQLKKGNHFGSGGFGFNQGAYEVSYESPLDDDLPAVGPLTTREKDNKNPGRFIGGPNTLSSTPLKFDSASYVYNYLTGGDTKFYRTIWLDTNNKSMHVTSIVRWKNKGGGSSEIRLEDFFFDNT